MQFVTESMPQTESVTHLVVDCSPPYMRLLLGRIKQVEASEDLDEFARLYHDHNADYGVLDIDATWLSDHENFDRYGQALVGDTYDQLVMESPVAPIRDTPMVQISEYGVQWMACFLPQQDQDPVTIKSMTLPRERLVEGLEMTLGDDSND